MILQRNCNVELTKVHYYDINHTGRNLQISTISRNEPPLQKKYKENTVIKKNIFGHKWVLKINENNENLKKSRTKLIVYIIVFVCIVLAVCCGIFFSVESRYFKKETTSKTKFKEVPTLRNSTIQKDKLNLSLLYNSTIVEDKNERIKEDIKLQNGTINDETVKNISTSNPCSSCNSNEEVCLNVLESDNPKCKRIVDKKDPTGCGGLCKINKEYCKLLDEEIMLFQCRALQNKLNCSSDFFNCGNRCIPKKLRCDGIFHCSDQSDEKNCDCDLNSHFQCGTATGCLALSKKCDGIIDCWDNSDEINCNRECINGQVPCHNGQCINKENFCDGIYQCPDKSDEPIGCQLRK